MLILGFRITSASSAEVYSEARCEPILPVPSRLLQPNNVTLDLLGGLHGLLGKTVAAVDGRSTDVECIRGKVALSILPSNGLS